MPGPQRINDGSADKGVSPKKNKESNNLGKSSKLFVETETLKRGKINTIQRKTQKQVPKKQIKLFLSMIGFFVAARPKTARETAKPEKIQRSIKGTTIIAIKIIFRRIRFIS